MNPLPDEPTSIDGLLDEWLGHARPRSLHVDSLRNRTYSPARLAEFDAALKAAKQDKLRLAPRRNDEGLKSRHTHAHWYILAAIAGCIAIAVTGWVATHDHRNSPTTNGSVDSIAASTQVVAPKASDEKSIPAGGQTMPGKQPTVDSLAAAKQPIKAESKPNVDKPRSERVKLSLDAVPFANQDLNASSKDAASNRAKVEPMSEVEIVALIDRSLKSWWQQYGVEPTPPINGTAWISRASLKLVSREPSAVELERFSKKDGSAARIEWIHQATGSQEFQRYWGKRLAAFYFGEPGPQVNEFMAERKDFVKWCQNEFKRSGMRTDLMTAKLIKLTAAPPVGGEFSADHYWWSENAKRGNQHVADLISTRFLERRGACDRCHESNVVGGADQAKYWGLAAITRGVKAEQSTDDLTKWSVAYRPKAEPLFYERSDSTMVAANPTLPDGKSLQIDVAAKDNLEALADWIVGSEEFAKSQVNFAWQVLFGAPLAGPGPIDERDGASERRALLKLLARQLVANDFDMRRLATWLTASQAFTRKPLDIDGNWYLIAGEKELETAHQRQALMAAFPITSDPSLRSMGRLVTWTEQIFPNNGSSGVLAQPLPPTNPGKSIPNTGTKNLNRERLGKLNAGQIQYLVTVYTLPEAVEKEIEGLLKTNLTWTQLVEHAYFISGSRGPSPVELEAAQKLLDHVRDRRQALHRIVAARL